MEISGDVTDAGRTDGRTDKRTREDSATQPMDAGWLSFAKMVPGDLDLESLARVCKMLC